MISATNPPILDHFATTCLLSMICLSMLIYQYMYEFQGAWSGPWVSTEVLAALIGIVVYYLAYSTKSAIQAWDEKKSLFSTILVNLVFRHSLFCHFNMQSLFCHGHLGWNKRLVCCRAWVKVLVWTIIITAKVVFFFFFLTDSQEFKT